jgi:dihydroorotase
MADEIHLSSPVDFHLHLRDGEVLKDTIEHAAASFDQILVMPNIQPPVRTVDDANAYRQRILDAAASRGCRAPDLLMTLYLTDTTTVEEIEKVAGPGSHVKALKLYPQGVTTNSEYGVTEYGKIQRVLRRMSELGIPLLVHGEVKDANVDIFDREERFIELILKPMVRDHPLLKVVMEHITTQEAVEFIKNAGPTVGATITAHHLLFNRNELFKGGICPHMYCLPILKSEKHRLALVEAATSGSPKFFLGTDSAPHAVDKKESACGCAGIFTGHAALELYAEAFEAEGRLDRLEAFACKWGRAFYGNVSAPTGDTGAREVRGGGGGGGGVRLVRVAWKVPDTYDFGGAAVRPLRAGEELQWRREG